MSDSPKKDRRGGKKPPRSELWARAAVLMDEGKTAAEIAQIMDVELGTAKGYVVGVRGLRGLKRPVKRTEGPLAVRFAAKVDRNGPIPERCPELGPCHIWTGAVANGYGRVRDTRGEVGERMRQHQAHKAVWMLANGSLPRGKFWGGGADIVIRHKCDNKLCVNLAHLEPGSGRDNMRDKHERGRAYNPKLHEMRCGHCRQIGHRRTKCPNKQVAA
jgi:hypothetical protein